MVAYLSTVSCAAMSEPLLGMNVCIRLAMLAYLSRVSYVSIAYLIRISCARIFNWG